MSNNKKLDLKIEDRDTLPLKVANVLRKAILKGDFHPGERLIQEDLAKALEVSRMPVREALRRLADEGLIEVIPHRGAVVKSLTIEDVREIYELRATLERLAVKQSVENIKAEDINRLEWLVSTMKETTEPETFVEANIEFHRALMKRCTWPRLQSFIETLWNGFPQQTPTMLPNQMYLSNKEHDEILEAVKSDQSERAADLIYRHITRTGQSLMESIIASKNESKEDVIQRFTE